VVRMARLVLLVNLSFLLPFFPPLSSLAGQDPTYTGVLRGRVVSRTDDRGIADARVRISRSPGSPGDPELPALSPVDLRSDGEGAFSHSLPVGRYDVEVEAFGFETQRHSGVGVSEGETAEVVIRLEPAPFRLDEIVVMPSTYGFLREHVVSGQMLSREELEVRPHMGNDIFRAVSQVPGVTAYDHSAVPYVRGARADEVLTILDGLELYEPYHLKQWDGSLSIVDVENVSSVDLTTGGFTAEFGDASAGVLSMRTATPTVEGMKTTVGLDFMSSILKSEGSFAGGRGAWLASARRGFLDLVFKITGLSEDQDLHPSYYDLFSKVQYEVRPGHLVSAHLLHAGDDNHGIEEDSTVYRHRYGSSYAWVSWGAEFTPALSAQTVLSVGRVWRDRNGQDYWAPGTEPSVDVRDEAIFDFASLRQDWQLRYSDRSMLKWGIEAKRGSADYDYYRWMKYWEPNTTDPQAPDWALRHDNLWVATERSGNELGAYVAGRVQPLSRLTLEAGLRYDRQSYTGEQQLSPRVNAALALAPRTSLRGAWGYCHQSQGLHQLWVADGDSTFYPAQRAEHRVLGLEHSLRNGSLLRVEAYQRVITDPLPEYRNLEDFIEGLREEGPEDRVMIQAEEGRAHGIELFAKGPGNARFVWSASYTLAKVEEKVDGQWVPRPFDQRHAVTVQLGWRPTPGWSVSLGWIYHSPWPYTAQDFHLARTASGYGFVVQEFGPLNQERLIPYHRLDFRASRTFQLEKGELLFYLDVFNATNRENAQAASYGAWILDDGSLVTDRTIHPQLEVMPSLGVRWVF
jgi:outer membrane receptor protein involved in Fe transport